MPTTLVFFPGNMTDVYFNEPAQGIELCPTSLEQKCQRVSQEALTRSQSPKRFLLDLWLRRRLSPITKESIHRQAKLHKHLRKAKVWAAEIADKETYKYTPPVANLNLVCRLYSFQSIGPIAYYKEIGVKSPDQGIMETLMYQIALIMGFGDLFTPTTNVCLRTKSLFEEDEKGISEKIWNMSRTELITKKLLKIPKGSFQSSQQGVSVDQYETSLSLSLINNFQIKIPHTHFIKASLAIIVMGLFDAHEQNILIDKQGKIKFFDNTCSMPHSNGCVQWIEDHPRMTFRSSLLRLTESYEPLTEGDRQFIGTEIIKYEEKYIHLEKFLNYPSTRSRIAKLPENWFNVNQSLSAMKDRIQNLKTGLANPQNINLCEISLSSQPNLKFFAILCIFLNSSALPLPAQHPLTEAHITSCQKRCFHLLGYEFIIPIFSACCKLGLDLIAIKNICDDPSKSFRDLVRNIVFYKNRIKPKEARANARIILRQLIKLSEIDQKGYQQNP